MLEKEEKNIEALSPTEQRVYSKLYSQRVINTGDVKEILGGSHKSADYINNLREKGYLQRVRKGLYVIAPPNLVNKEFSPDKFLIAGKVKDDYYLSYHSALELHGVAQSAYNRVWITCKNPIKSFSHCSIAYQFVTTRHYFGITELNRQRNSLKVSDREKTFLDCVRRPKYAGGWEELLKSADGFPYLDGKQLLIYLKKFDETGLYQKVGFILEHLEPSVSKEIMKKIESEVGDRTYYLDKGKGSHYLAKWNLMVPDNFKELVEHG